MPNKPRTVPAAQQFAPTLRLVGLAAFAAMASMRVCDAMLLELAREFQVSTGEAARVISFYALAYGAMQLIYGPLSERVGKLPVISCAAAGCALLSLLASQAASMDLLVASRVAMGAAAAGIVPLTIAWIGDQVPYERRQETLAKLLGATISGTMAGQWLGGLAADTLGWRAAFVALAGAFGVAALLLLRNTRRDWPARSSNSVPAGAALNQLRGTFELLAAPQVRWVLALTAAEGALAYGAMAFVPSRLVQGYGFTLSGAGALMLLFGVGGLLYSQLARRWIGLLGEAGLALTGGIAYASGLLMLAWTSQALFAATACVGAGFGLYMLHGTLQTLATQMAPQARGMAVALFACALFLGQAAGVQIVGAALDANALAASFSIAAVGLALLGAWVARHARLARRREQS